MLFFFEIQHIDFITRDFLTHQATDLELDDSLGWDIDFFERPWILGTTCRAFP